MGSLLPKLPFLPEETVFPVLREVSESKKGPRERLECFKPQDAPTFKRARNQSSSLCLHRAFLMQICTSDPV